MEVSYIILLLLAIFYSISFSSGLPPLMIINHGRQNLSIRCQSNVYSYTDQMIRHNDAYDLNNVSLGNGTIVKAWCTMVLGEKWGIFEVFNTGRKSLFCVEGNYCGWFVREDRLCLSSNPFSGCIKKYFWPKFE